MSNFHVINVIQDPDPFVVKLIENEIQFFNESKNFTVSTRMEQYVNLDISSLPLSYSIKYLFKEKDILRMALSGGDDYQLLFTSSLSLQFFLTIAANNIRRVRCINSTSSNGIKIGLREPR